MNYLNIKEYFKQEMSRLREQTSNPPSLIIVDATNDDPANQIYIRNKVKDFEDLGWKAEVLQITKDKPLKDFSLFIRHAAHYGYDNLIVQMPLRDEYSLDYSYIPPSKDCDGLNPTSGIIPATVRGIIDYLDACGFEYEGKTAVVLGRSDIVGKPMAKELLNKNMTVSVCHSHTPQETRERLLEDADLVVCAVGQAGILKRADCPNAFIVDVGINRVNGKLVGDFVEEEGMEETSTPVPGGVGLLTRLGLLKNCVDLKRRKEQSWEC